MKKSNPMVVMLFLTLLVLLTITPVLGEDALYVDENGNVGIGAIPNNGWSSSNVTLQINDRMGLSQIVNTVTLVNNAYWDGTNWKYQTTDESGLLQIVANGDLSYYSAVSGAEGNTISFSRLLWIDQSTGNIILENGNLILPNAGYIGSASDTDAIQIEADGDVVLSQKISIGTASPSGTLTVKSSGSSSPPAILV